MIDWHMVDAFPRQSSVQNHLVLGTGCVPGNGLVLLTHWKKGRLSVLSLRQGCVCGIQDENWTKTPGPSPFSY